MKKVSIYLVAAAMFLAAGCGNRQPNNECEECFVSAIYELHDTRIPIDSKQFYFPEYVFYEFDNFKNKWYSEQLFAMREPVIYSDTTQTEIYRFTWLRSFHNPISIRIEKQENIFLLTWKLCDGAGGYIPGQLIIAKQKQIDVETWDNFKTLLYEADFWNLDTKDDEDTGLDGSQIILEGKGAKGYHVVDRQSGGEISYPSLFLFYLTDLIIDEEEFY